MFGDRPALSPAEIFYQRMLVGDPTEAAEKAEEFLKERSLSSYYDDVAIKGLQLAQADLDRDSLDESRLIRIRDTVLEFANDLSDQDDHEPTGEQSTADAEAAAAVEAAAAEPVYADLPVFERTELPAEWQGESPILCIAGRTALDEAAGIMLAQLCDAHGPRHAPSESSERVVGESHIFRLETSGVAIVCLRYLRQTIEPRWFPNPICDSLTTRSVLRRRVSWSVRVGTGVASRGCDRSAAGELGRRHVCP